MEVWNETSSLTRGAVTGLPGRERSCMLTCERAYLETGVGYVQYVYYYLQVLYVIISQCLAKFLL